MFRGCGAPNTCYTCGQADHFDKECPHNNFYDQESNNQIVPKNDKDLNPNAAAFQPPSIPNPGIPPNLWKFKINFLQGDNSLLGIPPPNLPQCNDSYRLDFPPPVRTLCKDKMLVGEGEIL